ncbi:MAG: hypothetical protein RLZZ450_3058 [Pseudomonadota bacterium]|jgi:uncharacterized delta-60 repeat protein
MSVAKRVRHGWLMAPVLACSFVVGCGDDDEGGDEPKVDGGGAGDSGLKPDGSTGTGIDSGLDAGLDSGIKPDGGATGSDGGGSGITDKVIYAQISATGHDRFYGVTYDSAGNIYAVGQTSSATAAGSDSSFVLAKFSAAGVLDTTFGTSGYAIKNVVAGGLDVETARGVVIQADGKIVVAGQAEHQVYDASADAGAIVRDADVFVVRFTAQGQLDTTFGTAGVVRHDVGTGVLTQPATLADGGVPALALSGADSFWSLSLTVDNKLVIHTATRGLGNSLDGGVRTDSDFALVRLSADGTLDPTFGATGGTPGVVRTDFSNTNASVRAATVLANGSIVGAGYSTNAVLTTNGTTAQNPVLYKVNADGTPDTSFGTTDPVGAPGLWHDYARRDQKGAEAYGAAPQGTKFVTAGYGPTPNGTTTDIIFFRFNADGSQDRTFGTDGVTFVDVGGYADNGRTIATLPDNRIIGGGTGRVKPAAGTSDGGTPPADAVLTVLSENGLPDTTFGPNGIRTYDFGGAGDHIWGLSVSPSKKQVAAVGIQTGATPADDDDGAIVILNLP